MVAKQNVIKYLSDHKSEIPWRHRLFIRLYVWWFAGNVIVPAQVVINAMGNKLATKFFEEVTTNPTHIETGINAINDAQS